MVLRAGIPSPWNFKNRRISSSSLLSSFTPQLCKDKFFDLKRRFISPNDAASSSNLVDQLRRIRVEELRQEVQQRDVLIVSLKLKVKRLMEERERSLKEEIDLDDRQNELSPEVIAGQRDERSFNESNSTSPKLEKATTTKIIIKDEQNNAGEVVGEKTAQIITEPVERGADNETDPVRTGKVPGNKGVTGEELNNKKQMSDVQSSATLSRKKRYSGSSRSGSSSREEREGEEVSPAKKRASAVKPESLLRLLRIICTYRLGSAFDRLQLSQESERYKSLIRQHMDLQRIQYRLDKVACGKRSSIKALTENATRREDKKEREVEEKPRANEKRVDTSSFIGIDDKGIRKKRSKERPVSGRRNSLRTSNKSGEPKHEYGGNELSSHDAMELKVHKKENMTRKKQGVASFLKRMKQNSPGEVTEKDDDNNDDHDNSEDESKDGKKEKGRGRKRDVKRITRSSGGRGAREESGRVERGVRRPPKRVVTESTGKRRRDNVDNEVVVRGTGRTRKWSRR
ncbi:hypothetical protein CRYUN_Cryun03dG0109300 [Craigia yunnanensis]